MIFLVLVEYSCIFIENINYMEKHKNKKWKIKFDINKVLSLDKEGKNIKDIAKIMEISYKSLQYLIKKSNLLLNSKRQTIIKDHSYFENVDSEIKAYILGYTLADGSLIIEPKKRNELIYSYSKRLSFCVSIDDREIINLIQKEISPTSIIKEYHNSIGAINRKNSLSLRISSSKLIDDLISYNILPNKTYDINFKFNFNKLNRNLIRHFIRGFFDGDGSFNRYTLQFISTSKYFLEQILSYFLEEIPEITYRMRKCKGKTVDYYNLYFNTGHGIKEKIYKLFYENSNYYLQRKKSKFNIDNTVLIN